jgi:predicted RNA-binding Zn-ribbon protein involved in translation (DUF1610 family)
MFVPKNHEITMRCPVCFNRDIDVLMKLDITDHKYKCLKCSFSGTEPTVREYYVYLQKKFNWIGKRITIEDYEKL